MQWKAGGAPSGCLFNFGSLCLIRVMCSFLLANCEMKHFAIGTRNTQSQGARGLAILALKCFFVK